MAFAVVFTIFSFVIAVLAGMLLNNKENIGACICIFLSTLSAIGSAYNFRTTGFGTPLEESALETSVIYQVIGTPASHDEKTDWSNTENLVFLQTEKKDPLAYRLTKTPPPRFLVIKNEKGELEFLPRPLPKEKESKNKESSQDEESSKN